MYVSVQKKIIVPKSMNVFYERLSQYMNTLMYFFYTCTLVQADVSLNQWHRCQTKQNI